MKVRDGVVDEPLFGFVEEGGERVLSMFGGLTKRFDVGVVGCVWWRCA